MSHPRHVLCSSIFPSPSIIRKGSGLSCLRGYDGCSGQNSVYMTNIAALFARFIQCFSLTVLVMMSLMNPSIDASVALMYTARGYAFFIWFYECCLSSFGSKDLCGELRIFVSQ